MIIYSTLLPKNAWSKTCNHIHLCSTSILHIKVKRRLFWMKRCENKKNSIYFSLCFYLFPFYLSCFYTNLGQLKLISMLHINIKQLGSQLFQWQFKMSVLPLSYKWKCFVSYLGIQFYKIHWLTRKTRLSLVNSMIQMLISIRPNFHWPTPL